MNQANSLQMLKQYHHHGFSLVPLKPRSKTPLVRWKEYQLRNEDFLRFTSQGANWAVRCDDNFHALDFDSPETYEKFIRENDDYFRAAPLIRTDRGYHVWFKPKRPVKSFQKDGIEVKGLGSLVVVPPSIHPSGTEYQFEKPLDSTLPVVNLEKLFNLPAVAQREEEPTWTGKAPSDFALRYGKSTHSRSLCGLATKVITRSDGKVKYLVSLRCWKWDCPKCAPLLRRYWLQKLKGTRFRFILRLPTWDKPTKFLRRLGKPRYVHIVANGESWLFLLDGAELVWAEAREAGYTLVAGDAAGDPSPDEIRKCLDEALCQEEDPLNTRRKVTHSRGLVKRACRNKEYDESKQQGNCSKGQDNMKAAFGKEPLTWKSEVVMKPVTEVASQLEQQGWRILWKSEVEALAIKDNGISSQDLDIVELMETVGIKLKKVGNEYKALCPFHNDHEPSLSVNPEKQLWYCFGCDRGGDARKFIKEWQANAKH